jgi:hypothetical protein
MLKWGNTLKCIENADIILRNLERSSKRTTPSYKIRNAWPDELWK